MYNQGMPKNSQVLRLKEASQLTGALWAAYVYRENESWQAGDFYHLAKPELADLLRLLNDPRSAPWFGKVLVGGRVRMRPLTGVEKLPGARVYGFPAGVMTLVVAGVPAELSARDQRLWRLATLVDPPPVPSPGEVGLLQQTVMELQQTQQELQARISAQREAEARLIQAAKLAAVGEMAAGVAHELNNPLTSVVGFTELALEELPHDSPVRADLDLVLKEARRARSVVRRLLDFARQGETNRVKADLNEIVEDVLLLTRHLMTTNHVQMTIRLGDNLPWVLVDRNQIKQVVINLINNALYAMPEGGRLEVETSTAMRYNRSWVTLSVRDEGVGIAPEHLQRIFEPFFTTRGDRGGTGLGLSVTYGIVTDHGGMIEVESQVTMGSAFTVWLPLEDVS
jgi:signal transduction histidine kinase